jgi:hypothetical protein
MNTKSDIPKESGQDTENTDLELSKLPGDWTWGSVNHTSMTNKVNLFFGLNITETGGWYGEIDNFLEDGEEKWSLHVRPLVERPETPHGCQPRETAETVDTFDTLDAAIEAVPAHIKTNYETE